MIPQIPHAAKIIALGCSKNQCDAQGMAQTLLSKGWSLTDSMHKADAIIVHTCSFIHPAQEESEEMIRQAIHYAHKRNSACSVVVTGCLVQDDPQYVTQKFPRVKAFLGTGHLNNICQVISTPAPRMTWVGKPGGWIDYTGRDHLIPAHGSAFLRVSEGCSHRCSFCVIPRIRGRYVSRIFNDIKQEINAWALHNMREINIIGQDTTAYGCDRSDGYTLASVIKEIVQHSSVRFIRILYAHPATLSDDMVALIAHEPAVCKYLDMPLQHISTPVLKRMGRRMNESTIIKKVEHILNHIPSLALRTTFITGFPGETDKDFKTMLKFVEQGYCTHVGVFAYSQKKNTPAALFSSHIPEHIKEARKNAILKAQQKIIRQKNKKRIDTIADVLITGNRGAFAVGRSEYEAPEVDGLIYCTHAQRHYLKPGNICRVKITHTSTYDCYGEVLA